MTNPGRALLNSIWLVFAGWWLALMWLIVSFGLVLTIVGVPFAWQAMKIAAFVVWPFGHALVRRPDSQMAVPSAVGNVIWVVLAGWWLALVHIVAGVALTISIIGIPLALGAFKMVPVTFAPFGRDVVATDPHPPASPVEAVTVPARWRRPATHH